MKTDHWIMMLGLGALTVLSGCGNTLERLSNVGQEPPLHSIENPTDQKNYKPVSWPMPEPEATGRPTANSLWQPGAKAFFRDQRARRVGDILTIKVVIADKAQIDNVTERTRDSTENVGAPNILGFERKLINDILPNGANAANLISVNGNSETTGDGRINRQERIETKVAAMVTQVLPNGNMVIKGKQQVRVNYESREIDIGGVIRPEDIKSDNTIDLAQVAEARVSYGGRGTLSDLQQPRVGSQILDIISPF